jgi:hypothetical protein
MRVGLYLNNFRRRSEYEFSESDQRACPTRSGNRLHLHRRLVIRQDRLIPLSCSTVLRSYIRLNR